MTRKGRKRSPKKLPDQSRDDAGVPMAEQQDQNVGAAEETSHASRKRSADPEENETMSPYFSDGPDGESEQLASEILINLRAKSQEIDQMKDLLRVSMKHWVNDMMDKVDIVKNEVQSTRDLAVPTCAVLDKLRGKTDKTEDIDVLLQELLGKVEYMVKQLPVVTNIIRMVLEQVHPLETEVYPIKSDTQEDILEKPVELMEHSLERNPETECNEQIKEIVMNEDIAMSDQLGDSIAIEPEKRMEIRTNETTREILELLAVKDQEIEMKKNLLPHVIKGWMIDVAEKIEYTKTEATISRDLVYQTHGFLDETQCSSQTAREINDLASDITEKTVYMMSQVEIAQNILASAIDHIGPMQCLEEFRHEIVAATLTGLPKCNNDKSSQMMDHTGNGTGIDIGSADLERLNLDDDNVSDNKDFITADNK